MKLRDCPDCDGDAFVDIFDSEGVGVIGPGPCPNPDCRDGKIEDVGSNEDYRDPNRVRHYVPLDGGHIAFSADKDIDEKTVEAIKELGRAAMKKMEES